MEGMLSYFSRLLRRDRRNITVLIRDGCCMTYSSLQQCPSPDRLAWRRSIEGLAARSGRKGSGSPFAFSPPRPLLHIFGDILCFSITSNRLLFPGKRERKRGIMSCRGQNCALSQGVCSAGERASGLFEGTAIRSAGASGCARPVFHAQAGNMAVVALVVGHNGVIEDQGGGGNDEIEVIYWPPSAP